MKCPSTDNNQTQSNLMQTKQLETKSYSYHFTKIVHPAQQTNTPAPNQPLSPITSSKNISINFRYHTEGQDHDKRPLHFKRDPPKVHPLAEKGGETTKKYTFSLLASQARQQKALENQIQPNNYTQFMPRDSLPELQHQKPNADLIREKSATKKPVKTVQSSRPQRNNLQELDRDSEARRAVEKELAELRAKNEGLEKRQKQLESQIVQKNEQISGFIATVALLKHQKQQNGKERQLQLCPNVCVWQLEEGEPSFEKENKEWSTSTISGFTFQEEYKQVLAIFEVELNQEGFHDRLLAQIDRLLKKKDELNRWMGACRQKEKENSRLVHHLRRLQSDNMQFAHVASVLGKEHENMNFLLQESNRDIERLSLYVLNAKYQSIVE